MSDLFQSRSHRALQSHSGALVVSISLLALGCVASPKVSETRIEGGQDFKFARVVDYEVRGGSFREIAVTPNQGTSPWAFIDLRWFEPLTPGDRPAEVAGDRALDMKTRDGPSGREHYAAKEAGEVALVPSSSGDGTHWGLFFYPRDKEAARYIPAELWRCCVAGHSGSIEVSLLNPDGSPGIIVYTESGKVKSIQWANKSVAHTFARALDRLKPI